MNLDPPMTCADWPVPGNLGNECCYPHKRSQQVDDEDENNGEPPEDEALDADSSAD